MASMAGCQHWTVNALSMLTACCVSLSKHCHAIQRPHVKALVACGFATCCSEEAGLYSQCFSALRVVSILWCTTGWSWKCLPGLSLSMWPPAFIKHISWGNPKEFSAGSRGFPKTTYWNIPFICTKHESIIIYTCINISCHKCVDGISRRVLMRL